MGLFATSPWALLLCILLLPISVDLHVTYIGDQPLSILTYNAFFLPSSARAVTDSWGWWHRDHSRAKWITTHLPRKSFDFVCLMETFKPSARRAIMQSFQQNNYSVLEHFNADGWLFANSGLSFATKHDILESGFELYQDVTVMTSEMLARKGVGYVLVNVSSSVNGSALVCIFLTHTQAEVEGRAVRQRQFQQIYSFVRRKLKALQPQRCVVMMAGDFNVDGLLSSDSTEYESMMQALHNPTDLYRMLHPLEVKEEAATNEGARLDYIFVYPPRIGMPTAAIDVINCTVQRGWKAGNISVSDHDPVLAYFRIPIFDGKRY